MAAAMGKETYSYSFAHAPAVPYLLTTCRIEKDLADLTEEVQSRPAQNAIPASARLTGDRGTILLWVSQMV
eukprot:5673611-Amphidinium_carterae.1